MDPEKFKSIMFDLLVHHLSEIEENSYNNEMIDYHVDRCRFIIEYLEKETVAKQKTEQEIIEHLAR